MFSAPEAPAPTAMQSSEVNARTGWKCPGAITSPTSAVKIDERHHPRLQKREIVADIGLGNPGAEFNGVVIDDRQFGLASS